ncbi:porin family protein [Tenacibaculum xiamenense]|uniref:porin family protein n=1 Tax=Tenacibaculum xiamenense TaxID=1261553 RepID=UPI00389591FA
MKKIFVATLMFLGITVAAQETRFGVTAGYNMTTGKLTEKMLKKDRVVTTNDSGYFVGFFVDYKVNDKFGIQPELHYAAVYTNGNDSNFLTVPILAKYYINDRFNVQLGPMLDLILDDVSELTNTFGVGAAAGLGYDFSEDVYVSARYSFGLNNRIDQVDTTLKSNFLQVGIGYKF